MGRCPSVFTGFDSGPPRGYQKPWADVTDLSALAIFHASDPSGLLTTPKTLDATTLAVVTLLFEEPYKEKVCMLIRHLFSPEHVD